MSSFATGHLAGSMRFPPQWLNGQRGDIDDSSVIFNVDVIHPQLTGNDILLELAQRDGKPIWPA